MLLAALIIVCIANTITAIISLKNLARLKGWHIHRYIFTNSYHGYSWSMARYKCSHKNCDKTKLKRIPD